MSGSSRETFQDVRELSGGPPGCPRVVERLSRMFRSGREALLQVREWSGRPLQDVRKWSEDHPGSP